MNYISPLDNDDYTNEPAPAYYNSYYSRPSPYNADGRFYTVSSRNHNAHHDYQGPSSSQVQKYSDRHKSTKYPPELNAMFGALACDLCAVQVSSPIISKFHYCGKQHQKNVKRFLEEYCKRTGNEVNIPEPPRSHQAGSSLPDYCELCDATLISINDKLLHFSGKNHRKNERDPASAKKKKKTYATIDLSGRFGIGPSFSGDENVTSKALMQVHQPFFCELCDVKAVSNDQLQMHLSGKKHKEKLEKQNQINSDVPKPEKRYPCNICNVGLETFNLYNMHINGKKHAKALMKVEMEGVESCKICMVTFTSFDQYQQHINGKKHEKKCKMSYNGCVDEPSDTISIACKFCPFVGNLDNHECDQSLMKIENVDDLESKWVCYPCHNMVFDSEEEFNEHKDSRRHLMCALNQETGDKIIEELKHWYCFVCKKQYRSHKEYTDHLFQDRHKTLSEEQLGKIESKIDLFQCVVCNIVMDTEAKEEHMKDRNHLKKALKKDTFSTLAKLANENITSTSYRCSNCKVTYYDFIQYSNHVLSEEHIDIMINSKLNHS